MFSNINKVALVGSRRAPRWALVISKRIGRELSNRKIIGVSGDAEGMDRSWMADYDRTLSRIILPWEGFMGSNSKMTGYYNWAHIDNESKIKSIVHSKSVTPYYPNLSLSVIKLFARDATQVLGMTCEEPVDAVYYWASEINGKVSGGTRVAVDIARKFNIPTYNIGHPDVLDNIKSELNIKQVDIFEM